MSDWVLMKKYCDDTGHTPNAIHKKRNGGKIAEGIHWIKRDGNIYINVRAMDKWVENGLQSSSMQLAS